MQFFTLPVGMLILSATLSTAATLPTDNVIELQVREASDIGMQWQEWPSSVNQARSLLLSNEVAERATSEVLNRRAFMPGYFSRGSPAYVARKDAKAAKTLAKADRADRNEMKAWSSYERSSGSEKDAAYRWYLANEQRSGELREKANRAALKAQKAQQAAAAKAAKAPKAKSRR